MVAEAIEARPVPTHRHYVRTEFHREACPLCGDNVIAHVYRVPGYGAVTYWECWSSYGDGATCDYRLAI